MLSQKIIREDVLSLSAYSVQESKGFIKLDAMENPYPLPENLQKELGQILGQVAINRYPVPSYETLKEKIKVAFRIPLGFEVMLGNGSDELIFLLATALAKKDATLMTVAPTFVIYEMAAKFSKMNFVAVPLKEDFSLDMPKMLEAIQKHKPSILFLSYPNNPTGNLYPDASILELVSAMKDIGIVVSDEAYQPFAHKTMMEYLPSYENLVIMRTVSKLGLAGTRLGYLTAHSAFLNEFEKVRPPYNVNVLTEATANFALTHIDTFFGQTEQICKERDRLKTLLKRKDVTVFDTAANFVLVRVPNADKVFSRLKEKKVLIKNVSAMHPLLNNCLRITVGTPKENEAFLTAFNDAFKE